jgi:hypothetical protein
LEGGPPGFPQGFSCLVVLRIPTGMHHHALQDFHPLWLCFPAHSGRRSIRVVGPTTPPDQTIRWFGLLPFRSPLLRESRLISVPPVTEMFQFSGFAPMDLCIQSTVTLAGRVSPFGNQRIKAHLPAPRCLSQAVTSFIAYHCQGIHHMHLFA